MRQLFGHLTLLNHITKKLLALKRSVSSVWPSRFCVRTFSADDSNTTMDKPASAGGTYRNTIVVSASIRILNGTITLSATVFPFQYPFYWLTSSSRISRFDMLNSVEVKFLTSNKVMSSDIIMFHVVCSIPGICTR